MTPKKTFLYLKILKLSKFNIAKAKNKHGNTIRMPHPNLISGA